MRTEAKIAEFKSRLSEYLRSVRRGNEVVIKDRETPIARVMPFKPAGAEFSTKPPTRTFQEIEKLVAAKPRKKVRLKPGVLERAIREIKIDRLDKWTRSKSTSTRR